MLSFSRLDDYAGAFAEAAPVRRRGLVIIGGVRWRPHPGHTRIEYEFDARIGYNVPVREVRHEGCIVDAGGRVYCPHCRTILPPATHDSSVSHFSSLVRRKVGQKKGRSLNRREGLRRAALCPRDVMVAQ